METKIITEKMLDLMISENLYYYLLSDIMETSDVEDPNNTPDDLDNAIANARLFWEKRDETCEEIKSLLLAEIDDDTTLEDIINHLFVITEKVIY